MIQLTSLSIVNVSDPKLPSSFQRGLRNLEASIEDSITDAKRSVSGGSSARAIEDTDQNVEIIFAVDVSRGVSLDELEESLAFAQEHVETVFFSFMSKFTGAD